MRDRHLLSIERLRKFRERMAAAALAASAAGERNAVNAVTSFEGELRSQSARQVQMESSLYEKALANVMTDRQMNEMALRIQEGRELAARMSKRLAELREEAAKAAAGMEAARLRHSASLRASKKWEKLTEHFRKQAALEELRRGEGFSLASAISANEMDSSPC